MTDEAFPLEGEPADTTAPAGRRPAALNGHLLTLLPYVIAGVIFVGVGVLDPRFMLNWSPGILLLLVIAWAIPAAWRRWRRRP